MTKNNDRYNNTGSVHTDPENDKFLKDHEPVSGKVRSSLFQRILDEK